MDYREKYNGDKENFYFFLKDEIIKLFKSKLKIDGHLVVIPDYENLDYLVKFNSNENYGDFTISVNWGEKPKQTKTSKSDPNQNEEFGENSKLAETFKENTNINNDGMEIDTNISFDYEPSKFK
ncbi:hypothetical protein KPL37_09305 [Clostridium frigoris]|uniref:Amphi-Trp domain-containing protein n=1 Tax=Clostridium frigoris TaxID=205327 RepID=A0ABS6BSQ0_9CLOT|nr:hypothetical protein [Clostridium frigoris]MBU3159949.1 hypothetical protein [Clostridium frigoris]